MSLRVDRHSRRRVHRRHAVIRGAGFVAGASLLAASGCAIITQLSTDDLTLAADASSDGSADATTAPRADGQSPPIDARSDGNAIDDAGPLPDVAVPCIFNEQASWQRDCDFGNGGYAFLEDPTGPQPPVITAAQYALFVAAGTTAENDLAVVYVYTTSRDPDAAPSTQGTFARLSMSDAGLPTDVEAVPQQHQSEANAVLLSNTADGKIALSILLNSHSVLPPIMAAVPNGSLRSLALADFGADGTSIFVVANHVRNGIIESPALVTMNFLDPDATTVYDVAIDAGTTSQPAVSQAMSFGGGWIGTSTDPVYLSKGALYSLNLAAPDASLPDVSFALPFSNFLPSAMRGVDSGIIAAAGPVSDGGPEGGAALGGIIYHVGHPTPAVVTVPVAVDTVRMVADGVGYVAIAHTTSGKGIIMARFLPINGGSAAVLDPSFASDQPGGFAFIPLPEGALTKLGGADIYGTDICFAVQVVQGDLSARNMVICTRTGTNVLVATGDSGVEASDASDASADAARDN